MTSYLRLCGTLALLAGAACAPHELGVTAITGSRVGGAHVHMDHPSGVSFDMHRNAVADYSAATVASPLEVCVERQGAMRCLVGDPESHGACNACHAAHPSGESLPLGSRIGESGTGPGLTAAP